MIVAVAGIPHEHYNRIQKKAPRLFGNKPVFIGTPLRPADDGTFRIDADHLARLSASLAKTLRVQPGTATTGFGLLVLAPAAQDPAPLLDRFRPFGLVKTVPLPEPVVSTRTPGEIYGNRLEDALRTAFLPLARAAAAMRTEVTDRLKRTPLLLPLRNFESDLVTDTIRGLVTALPQSDHPADTVAQACDRIEAQFPFVKASGQRRRCFMSPKDIQFRAPDKALHGVAVSDEPPHNTACLLNGLLRLGGGYHPGFHYDCTRDHSGGKRVIPLTGTFSDCHDARETKTGDPHLNIAPNDNIRE